MYLASYLPYPIVWYFTLFGTFRLSIYSLYPIVSYFILLFILFFYCRKHATLSVYSAIPPCDFIISYSFYFILSIVLRFTLFSFIVYTMPYWFYISRFWILLHGWMYECYCRTCLHVGGGRSRISYTLWFSVPYLSSSSFNFYNSSTIA